MQRDSRDGWCRHETPGQLSAEESQFHFSTCKVLTQLKLLQQKATGRLSFEPGQGSRLSSFHQFSLPSKNILDTSATVFCSRTSG